MRTSSPQIHHGDALDVLPGIGADSVDLIVTSPPYADQRKSTYGGVPPDEYVDWFLPHADEFLRILKPSGSFVLNIKEKVVAGERHTYVLDLIMKMRAHGWCWTDEYIWHKRNCYPGKWPNRFRDAWERLLHFTKTKRFKMNQEAVMVPTGAWARTRLRNLSNTDRRRDESKVESGFGKNISNWVGRDMAYPTNVLHLATECANRSHSAAFPRQLPEWFIRLFTDESDTVMDPFMGSGTTIYAAMELQRYAVGIDRVEEYCKAVQRNFSKMQYGLLEQRGQCVAGR